MRYRRYGVLLAWTLLSACSLIPQQGIEREAKAQGFEWSEIEGKAFRHELLANRAAIANPVPQSLHVYIDGDGRPWLGPGRPAFDPGPNHPLLLRLMGMDLAPAVYLGRPCYLGHARDPGCHPWHWTHGRYGEPVVASMAAALTNLRRERGNPDLVLIGYSGGGTLAMLLTPRVQGVKRLVTLAGNLDPERWARRHEYSPLKTSLNPSRLDPLPTQVRQIHIAGADDRNLPPEDIRAALAHQPTAELWVVPGMDHRCCWEREWPALLQRILAPIEAIPDGTLCCRN